MMIEVINKMCEDGTIKKLHRAGFISQKLFTYKSIYNHFAKLIKEEHPFTEAVHKTSAECKVTVRTVYKVIKTFNG